MDDIAQTSVRRLFKTNHHFFSCDEAERFIQRESKNIQRFNSALRIALNELPSSYKAYFYSSPVLETPWSDPEINELCRLSVVNRKPLSYTILIFNCMNAWIKHSMSRLGIYYTYDHLDFTDIRYRAVQLIGMTPPPHPSYPIHDKRETIKPSTKSKDSLNARYDRAIIDSEEDLSRYKPRTLKISGYSEKALFGLLKSKCIENCVPVSLIPKLLPALIRFVKTGSFPTLLLVGNPGCGKTYLSKLVADILGLPLFKIDAQSASTSRGLVGDSKTYNRADAGAIFDAIRKTGTTSICVCIDEIEKASTRRESVHNISDELLPALDGCRMIHDVYLNKDISTAGMAFILTANDEKLIAPWLKDRCTVIRFPEPDFDRLHAIMTRYTAKISNNELYSNRITLEPNLIDIMIGRMLSNGQTSIRQYVNTIDDVFDQAYLSLLETGSESFSITDQMIIQSLESRSGNGRPHFGFSV